jgi:hypothetical protein
MRVNGGKTGTSGGIRRFLRAPVLSVACVLASALVAPTVVNAFSNGGESSGAATVSLAARGGLGSFTPASVDPRLSAQVSIRAMALGKLFRFTPAGMDSRPDRAVTVAVRMPDAHAGLIGTHAVPTDAGAGFAALRIAPVAYNLGMARGYQSFALPAPAQSHDLIHDYAGPRGELRAYSIAPQAGDATGASPRLGPSVSIDDRSPPGHAPRTLGTQGDYQVNMGGAYRLVGNLDVTAGMRYSADRDSLRALTDHRQDSQALYVGTQFRF